VTARQHARPLVSVVITCYDYARFLREAVESVRHQTLTDFEVIVVDDGSTDDTPTVAASLPGIRFIRQANQGLSAARNTGWRASRGRYLVFLDADDRLLPDALQAGIAAAQAHPDAGFVSGHYAMIDAHGTRGVVMVPPCVASDHYGALLRRNYIGMHATVVYPRETFDRFGGFDRALSSCEDYDVYLRIARSAPIVCHPQVVAEYRWHGGNMSRNNTVMLATALRVLRRQWPHVRGRPAHEAAYRAGVAYWQELFGEPLLDDFAGRLYAGSVGGPTLRMLAVLLRCHPGGLGRRATKVARRLAREAWQS
jgi:glycosyltransferase involved in cell wall biosynthesis